MHSSKPSLKLQQVRRRLALLPQRSDRVNQLTPRHTMHDAIASEGIPTVPNIDSGPAITNFLTPNYQSTERGPDGRLEVIGLVCVISLREAIVELAASLRELNRNLGERGYLWAVQRSSLWVTDDEQQLLDIVVGSVDR